MKRSLVVVLALPLLLVLGLCGTYLARNPEREALGDDARRQAPGRFARLADGVTHYEMREPDSGATPTGRTAVLVHGFSVPMYIWDSSSVALSRAGYRVLRYDLFGRGWSDRPDVSYDADLFVRQLAQLLDSAGVREPVDLMGLSMGGWVTASFTAAHPARTRTLTLIDPVAEPSTIALPVRLPLIGPMFWQGMVVPGMAAGQPGDFLRPERFPDWEARYEPQMRYEGFGRALRSSAMALAATDLDSLYARAGRTNVPVLLVWGREDRAVPITFADRVRRAIPSARWFPVDSAGHLPHMEKSAEVHAEILRFLASVTPGGAAATSPPPADSTR